MYAANEELLRMNWDIGEMLTKSQETDGWGKKTLQRLTVDLKNEVSWKERILRKKHAVHDAVL